MGNEIRLFEASPSLKDWPWHLLGGGFLILTAPLLFMLTAVSVPTAGLLAAAGCGLVSWPALKAANSSLVVTNRRIQLTLGPWPRRVQEASLAALREVRVRRTPLQQRLGLGDLEIDAGDVLLFPGVEDPDRLRERLLALK